MSEIVKSKSQEEDTLLVKEFLNNNKDSFNKLMQKYRDMIFNLCFRIMGDYDDANDCAQEVFIKVYKNLRNFKFRSGFSTWIYRIAVNTCRNELSSLKYRMKKKIIRISNENNEAHSGMLAANIQDSSSNPEELYEKKEREELIQNAVNSLRGREKILLVLRDIEGKSYEEIASITGIALGTVKSGLSRARQEMANLLRGVL